MKKNMPESKPKEKTTSSYSIQTVLLLVAFCYQTLALAADTKEESKEPPDCKYCPDYTGWSGWLEGGAGYQSDNDYHFGRYTGYEEEGGVLNASGEVNYRDEDGSFMKGKVENLGIESRRIQIENGIQGKYELGIEYDQLPNLREENTYTPFRDQGGGQLGLPSGWVSGATTSAMTNLNSALVKTPLQTERKRIAARFAMYPTRKWEFSAYTRHEVKDGIKDLGATFSFDQTVYLPVPFKYETDEFGVSMGYTGDKLQSQFSYTGSLFDNEHESITWRNPFENDASNTAQGRMAEAPDNEFHQVSAILGYQLGDATRMSARLARGRMTQNQDFLPYTINPSITTTALPANSLDGEVNTTLASFKINSRPLSKLQLDGSYTYSDRDNKSSVNIYDYVITDSSAGGQRKNRPYSFMQRLLRLKAAYRFPKNVKLSVGYDDEQKNRTYVQVEETRDKTVWTKLKLRPLDTLETSIKYSYAERDASPYVPLSDIDPLLDNPNANFYDNPLMRVLHLAERTRDKLGFELSYMPVSKLSLGLDLDYFKDEYNSTYLGLQEADGLTSTLSLSYAFSETLSASAFYTYDKLSSDQKGSEKLLTSDPEDLWIASSSNLTDTIGLNLSWAATEELDLGADLAYAEFTGKLEFANSSALPKIGSTLRTLKLHGTYRLTEEFSVRAEYRYEEYEEQDWSKDGAVDTLSTVLSLGSEPLNTATSLAFVSLRYNF